ncbi:hypothetical protein FRC10_011243 [Ceratobasidium sp. 414]|nr:hypothetical protein FRC10_011243 [Ceratobasidium sp. 414]
MPATSIKIFILGATGYIGGAIVTELLRTSVAFTITALVRKDQDVETLEVLGIKTIKGSFTDVDKIEEASREADIVYNAADADDMSLTQAVLKGLKSKKERGILIQTRSVNITHNTSLEDDVKGIPPTQPHRNVDLEGEIDAYIIAPSCIYGIGDGPVNKLSQQVPRMIRSACIIPLVGRRLTEKFCRAAIEFKQPVYVGKGTNLWNNVHISDLIPLYNIILNLALSVRSGQTPRPEVYTNFYFASVREHAWGDIAKRIGPILLAKGKVEKAEARSIKASKIENFSALSTNSRSVSERGRNLGWTTVAKSLEDSLEENIDAVLAALK